MALTSFEKYQGLGNDFLLIDFREHLEHPILRPIAGLFPLAQSLCDRRFGVGGDGIMAILPPQSEGALATMRVLNSDASEAEMCGNGLRCVAKTLITQAGPGSTEWDQGIFIDTLAGRLHCQPIHQNDDFQIRIAMGAPRLLRREIPMSGDGESRCIGETLRVGEESLGLSAVSMGNPHAIHFASEGDDLMAMAKTLGPIFETSEHFPERSNIEFARVTEAGIDLVVWERGCGITMACGTGACATVVAACLEGHWELGKAAKVELPGGALEIEVAKNYSEVYMTGPAELVFRGEFSPAFLA